MTCFYLKTAEHKFFKNDRIIILWKVIKKNISSYRLSLIIRVGLTIKSLLKFKLGLIFGETRYHNYLPQLHEMIQLEKKSLKRRHETTLNSKHNEKIELFNNSKANGSTNSPLQIYRAV